MSTYVPTKPLDYEKASFSLRIGVGAGGRWKSGYRSSFNLDVGSTPELIWPGSEDLIFQAGASTLLVASSSAADDVGGTGARRVLIVGLDADYNSISEIVDTNGIAGTTTALSYLRLNSAVCLNVGSSEVNVGIISITSTSTTDLIGYISASQGKHLSSVVTAPKNSWLGINDFYAEVSGDDTLEILFESRHPGDAWRTISALIVPNAGNISRHWHDSSPVMIQPESDVRIIASKIGGGQSASCSVSYSFYVIDSREIPLTDDLDNI